jgi:CYTH domain-containing protein
MIEIEKTFLAKYLPNISDCEKKEMLDIYVPTKDSLHARIRIRKQGDKYEITKKTPINDDHSQLLEETIHLFEDEFKQFEIGLKGKRVHKNRFYLDYEGRKAEIDVFLDDLKGLIVIEFEFKNVEEMNSFKMPDFCLADVSQEDFIAGGMLCGKKYSDLEKELNKFNYKKIDTNL